jgi:hypothetical protein
VVTANGNGVVVEEVGQRRWWLWDGVGVRKKTLTTFKEAVTTYLL